MPMTARRNSARQNPLRQYRRQTAISSILFFLAVIATTPTHADGEISQLMTSSVTATPSTIVVDGVNYQWGQGNNLQIDGFFDGNDQYVANLKANSVSVLRDDIPDVAIGELCGIFAEHQGSTGKNLNPDFPALADHAGICDMSSMLISSVINRGTLDTFTNTGLNPNNIERIDYLFDGGINAPSDPTKLSSAGHVIGEKQGNNIVQMAAILDIDASGNPTEYGPLVRVNIVGGCTSGGICYGKTSIVHDYAFFKSRSLEPLSDLQMVDRVTEPVAFAFLSMETLGIPAGGIYYGVSVFPHDVIAGTHNPLDISTFPDDTEEPASRPNDSADIYGGSAFLYTIPSGITGRVFCQADEGTTAPKPNVPISLFQDTIEDGVLDPLQDQLIAEIQGTTMEGQYSFLGLENGSYFVAVSDQFGDDTASLAVVVNSGPVDDADIFLDAPCQDIIGPKANPDTVDLTAFVSTVINVLQNDTDAAGTVDAAELRLVSVTESPNAELEIQGRTVSWSPTAALRAQITPDNRVVVDTFTYLLEDDQGLTSEAIVTVTVRVPDAEPPCDVNPLPPECLFVETEVDGVGRIPPLVCFLLLTFVVIRRNALFVNSMGDQS